MEDHHWIKEGKNKSARWAELSAIFLAVIEELTMKKDVSVSTDLRAWPYGRAGGNGNWVYQDSQREQSPVEITMGM